MWTRSRGKLLKNAKEHLYSVADLFTRGNDAQLNDQARVEQLHALSTQARKNREQLLNRTANVQVRYEHSSDADIVSCFLVFYHLILKNGCFSCLASLHICEASNFMLLRY